MTLNAVRPGIIWAGDGTTSSITLSSEGEAITYQSTSYIKVRQLIVATGVTSLLTEGVEYSISLTDVDPGDTVSPATLTRIAGLLPSGYVWAIYREQPYQQTAVDIQQGGDFNSTDVEAGMDRSREIDQEEGHRTVRSLRLSYFDDPDDVDMVIPPVADNAGKVLILNDDENGWEFSDLTGVDFSIGTVTTLAAGSTATVEIVEADGNDFTLNFGIPRGATGLNGSGSGDLLAANNGSDFASASSTFTTLKQAATTGATGVVELATDAEASAGSDTTRYITAAQLHESRVDVASATTTDLGAVASNFARITGTVTITSLGTAADGVWRDVTFSAALLLTHNASTLIIPGGASITTAANDRMRVRSLGSGNWIVLAYFKTSGAPLTVATTAMASVGTETALPVVPTGLFPARADISSAATTAIGAASSMYLRILGVVTITSFGTIAAGIRRWCVMEGILILTHNATSLILPGGASITTAAGDTFEAVSEGSGNWRVLNYVRASGASLASSGAGKIVTRAYGEYVSNADLTTLMPYDDTVPTSTEGDEVLTVSITLSSAANRVRITIAGFGVANSAVLCCALFRDAVGAALVAWAVDVVGNGQPKAIDHVFEYAPSLTGSVTFKLRVGPSATGAARLNGNISGRKFGGAAAVKMVVEEVVP